MKTMKSLVACILMVSLMFTARAEKAEWKELNYFHEVMAKTFHPAEDGNFKPLKENAANLVTKAKAWQASKVPAGFDKEVSAKILVRLVAKCEEVEAAVKANKSDEALLKVIGEAHDIFHELVEKCRK